MCRRTGRDKFLDLDSFGDMTDMLIISIIIDRKQSIFCCPNSSIYKIQKLLFFSNPTQDTIHFLHKYPYFQVLSQNLVSVLKFKMEVMSTKSSLEFDDGGAYVDDDVFFADITRQILLLTADDEDFPKTKTTSSFSTNVAKRSFDIPAPDSSSLGYISWLGNKNTDCSVPASLSKQWENSNGTGVFIPQAVNPRSNYKPSTCSHPFL